LPINPAFFPRLPQASGGIVGIASRSLQQQVQNTLAELVKRPDLIQIVGPKSA
jgi:hypothetical protein